MVSLSADDHDRLFVGSGALSAFSTKIQVAYALGVIGPQVRHDLDSIREVRNAFAHTNLKIDFDTTEVAGLCNGLHCLAALEEPKDIDSAKTPRTKFVAATKILMLHLASKWTPNPENNPYLPAKVRALT